MSLHQSTRNMRWMISGAGRSEQAYSARARHEYNLWLAPAHVDEGGSDCFGGSGGWFGSDLGSCATGGCALVAQRVYGIPRLMKTDRTQKDVAAALLTRGIEIGRGLKGAEDLKNTVMDVEKSNRAMPEPMWTGGLGRNPVHGKRTYRSDGLP